MTRLHKMLFSLVMVAAAGLMTVSQARSQTTPTTAVGTPAATTTAASAGVTIRQGSSGVRYISGGAGASERAELDAQRQQFPFKLVLSADQGEYIVADKLILRSSKAEVLNASQLGPFVLIDAPSGSYTLEISYKGQTRRQEVTLGSGAKQLNIRFSG